MADEPKLEEVKPEPEVKPGKKSSEHLMAYVAIGISIATALVAELALPDTHWAVKGIAIIAPILVSMGYSKSRGEAKAGAAKK